MRSTHKYSAGGKAQRILARLREGAATTPELKHAAEPDGSKVRRDRAIFMVRALADDRLIAQEGHMHWIITGPGLDALRCLESGYPAVMEGA